MNLNKANKTFIPQVNLEDRKWWVVDASDLVLGRMATRVADILRGKDKAIYTPFMDTGDFVVVINAEKIKLTGSKEEQKMYYRHSGWMGGIKETSYAKMKATYPERIIMKAVKGMLPKNKLNDKILTKLKVYKGNEHNHEAQKPVKLEI